MTAAPHAQPAPAIAPPVIGVPMAIPPDPDQEREIP